MTSHSPMCRVRSRGAIHGGRAAVNLAAGRFASAALIALALAALAGCAIHQFVAPDRDWMTRNGQLSYHGNKRVVIGELLVRWSNRGDLELTFTKGPGVVLVSVKTDPTFARVQGPLMGLPWSGPIAQAPMRARGWLALRDELLRNPQTKTIRLAQAGETFVARF